MREHTAVEPHKGGVSRHSHIELHVPRGLAVGVLHLEAEEHGALGVQGTGIAFPHHAGTVRQLGHRAVEIGL